jgi:hypothetical protein
VGYQICGLSAIIFCTPDDAEHGLVEWRGEIEYALDHPNGLPCDRTYAMVMDRHSNLWLYTECGLISIKSDDLQQWRRNPGQKVSFDLLDAYDGVQPYPSAFSPRATRSNDGRLWFANGTVAQVIDPDRLYRNAIPPPVHIEDVIADGKSYSTRNGLHHRSRHLCIGNYQPSAIVVQEGLSKRELVAINEVIGEMAGMLGAKPEGMEYRFAPISKTIFP